MEINLVDLVDLACSYEPLHKTGGEVPPASVVQPKIRDFTCKRCQCSFPCIEDLRNHVKLVQHSAIHANPSDDGPELIKNLEGKLILTLNDSIFSFWRCIITDSKRSRSLTVMEVIQKLASLKGTLLLIILFRAGSFAAGIYDLYGLKISEKTFKRYTVRSQQGGAQSAFGGSKPYHSAGSLIRAQNERRLAQVLFDV
jgi:hypothetical protein